MKLLQQDNDAQSLQLLKQAEMLLINMNSLSPGSSQQLLGLTLNNFGCYYKK